MLTQAHKSLKRDKHKLFCKSFGQEHFMSLFLITQTYNCSREWLCDYYRNSLATWCQLAAVLHRSGSNRNRWGLPEGGAKLDLSRNAADLYQVEIWGDSLMRTEAVHGLEGWPPQCKVYCCWQTQFFRQKCDEESVGRAVGQTGVKTLLQVQLWYFFSLILSCQRQLELLCYLCLVM